MPGHRERDPQAADTQRAQPPQPQRQAHRAVLTGESGDPVDRIVGEHFLSGVIRRGKSGNQGISPGRQPS